MRPARQAVVPGIVRGIEQRLALQGLAAEEQRQAEQGKHDQREHLSRHASSRQAASPRVTAQSQPAYAPSCSRARRASSMVMPLMVCESTVSTRDTTSWYRISSVSSSDTL